MIEYEQPMFRPPSEANSLLIQATVGCSHNNCTYCAMYRQLNQKFRIRSKEEIFKIISERSSPDFRRSFKADGNALIMPTKTLTDVIKQIRASNPNMERISLYGNVKDILRKKEEDLKTIPVSETITLEHLTRNNTEKK